MVLPTPMTTVSEDSRPSMSHSRLGTLPANLGRPDGFHPLLTLFSGIVCDCFAQLALGEELVSRENALHHTVLLLDRNQHGHVDVINKKHPESEHHEEMNFTQPLDVDEPRNPAEEKTERPASEYVREQRKSREDFDECHPVHGGVGETRNRVVPDMTRRRPAHISVITARV